MASPWTTLNLFDLYGGTLDPTQLVFTPTVPIGSYPYARAIGGQSQGKFYFEIGRPGSATHQVNCGITLLSATGFQLDQMTVGAFIGQYGAGCQCVINGTSMFADVFTAGPTQMGFAVDLDAGLIWVRGAATAPWNNGNGGNPETGTGGFSLGALAGQTVYPALAADTEVMTCNFGQSTFLGAVPAGFIPGWPGVAMPNNLVEISATTTSITMGWTGPTPVPTSYTLQYRLTGTTVWADLTGLTETSATVSGLASGTQYDFQVAAVNVEGQMSPWTATVMASTLSMPAPMPIMPKSLQIWRGAVGINWYGKVLIGDAFSGVIGAADFDAFTEYGNPMRGLVIAPPIHADRKRIFIPRFELDVESGVGLTTGQGSDPVWMLDYSKDGGRTWSSLQKWRSMGKTGAYRQRLRWLRLGQSRQWLFRLQSTDPVRRVIIGAYADIVEGMG